jgi:DNA anti-recombination protein RmuC
MDASAAIGEGIPPPQNSRTTQLNMSMIETKVRKLEESQMRIAGDVRAELQGMFSERIKSLEGTVSEAVAKHTAELARQQSHFSSLCGRLERSMADLESQLKQQLAQQATQSQDRHDELSQQTKASMMSQALSTEKSLQDYGVKLAQEIRELDEAFRTRIDRDREMLDAKIDSEARTLNEKFGDVCVGIDNKVTSLFDELSSRTDSVVEGINTSLQSFDSELHRSNTELSKQIGVETRAVSDAVSTLEAAINEKLSNTAAGIEQVSTERHELLEVQLARMDLAAQDAAKAHDERVDIGLAELKGFCAAELAEQSALLAQEQASTAEQFEAVGTKLVAASERTDQQAERLEAAVAALREEEVEPLSKRLADISSSVAKEFSERVSPIEKQLGDFLLKTEYKTGKMLDTMKIEEIIAAIGEMNDVIQEVDPTEKILEFEDTLNDMSVDLQLTMAMASAVSSD